MALGAALEARKGRATQVGKQDEDGVTLMEEFELDAPTDDRPRLAQPVQLDVGGASPNVLTTEEGILTALTEGGMRHLMAGIRANVGIKKGRYAFEACILEVPGGLWEQGEEGEEGEGSLEPDPGMLVRIGFSTAGSSLFLGDGLLDSVCFESTGNFVHGEVRAKATPFLRCQTVALVLNLNLHGRNASTVSLFRDGKRASKPMPLPGNLRKKTLYPTVSYRNATLRLNFGPGRMCPLSFNCRLLGGASEEDVEVVRLSGSDVQHEVLFPVCLPGHGGFDWAEEYLEKHPTCTELSDRSFLVWARSCGYPRSKGVPLGSRDKPTLSFGVPSLEDGRAGQHLREITAWQRRSFVVMELRSNLIAVERREAVSRFSAPWFRKIAVVLVGEPRLGKSSAGVDDLSESVLAESFIHFSLPQSDEGFDEIQYAWLPQEECTEYFRKWVLERKLTLRVANLSRGAWFKERWSKGHKFLETWRRSQKEWRQVLAQLREWQGDEKDDSGDAKLGVDFDPDLDVSTVTDVTDIGSGEPLFGNFTPEDWALLALRCELHLLVHAFVKDVADPERTRMHVSLVGFYYNLYFEKDLIFESFGVSDLEGLVDLVPDTLHVDQSTLQSRLPNDTDFVHFLKLSEICRRDRMKAVDAGDESAVLDFCSPKTSVPASPQPSTKPVGRPHPPGQVNRGNSSSQGRHQPAKRVLGQAIGQTIGARMSKIPRMESSHSSHWHDDRGWYH